MSHAIRFEAGPSERSRGGAPTATAFAIALALSVATSAFAAPPQGPGGGTRGPRPGAEAPGIGALVQRNADELGVSDETLEQIRILGASLRERSKGLQEDIRKARRSLSDAVVLEPPNEAAVMSAAEALGAAELALRKSRLRYELEVQSLLTPEQRATLASHREGRGDRSRMTGGAKRMRPTPGDGKGPGMAKGKGGKGKSGRMQGDAGGSDAGTVAAESDETVSKQAGSDEEDGGNEASD